MSLNQPYSILLIETSTSLCSVALAQGSCAADATVKAYRQSEAPRAHAAMTAVYIKEVLEECGLSAKDCAAVCVSSGPGSYTGLRVGSSSAKGICFGAGIPLIAVGTLDILAAQAVQQGWVEKDCRFIMPMIDARRMEVYSAVYEIMEDGSIERKSEVKPQIIDADSFREQLSQGKALFVGDGAEKAATEIVSTNEDCQSIDFVQCCPNASAMAALAFDAFTQKRFEKTAYFEPFYLKDFVATVGKKMI